MFNDRPYHEVNREERFFCFLLGHALLASASVRAAVVGLLRAKLGLDLKDDDPLQVFVEVAALRDYWRDLGDPLLYDADTHSKRRSVLATSLREVGLPESLLDQHGFFWTSPERQKLWSPGRWSEDAIKAAGLDPLLRLKWAFNAKPDLMLVTGEHVILIEAKVESGEGKSGGYAQLDIQKLIAQLMHRLVPAFSRSRFINATLEVGASADIRWADVCRMIEGSDVDAFTKDCCRQLARFGYKEKV